MGDARDAPFQKWRAKVAECGKKRVVPRLKSSIARLKKRVAELEATVADLEKLQKKRKAALSKVYRNSERQQRARAERGQSGCEACARNVGISRRCLSPNEGPPGDALIMMNQVHAIEVGEHGTRFCTTCRGLQDHSGGSHHDDKHAPAWRGVLEPLTCAELGAPQRAGSPPYPTHYVFRPIPSAGP